MAGFIRSNYRGLAHGLRTSGIRSGPRHLRQPFRQLDAIGIKSAVTRIETLAQLDRLLSAHVLEQNRKDRTAANRPQAKSDMSITGASYLAETVRDRIAKAKKSIADAHGRIASASDQIDEAAGSAQAVAAAIEQEAAELRAEMVQLTNGPPVAKE